MVFYLLKSAFTAATKHTFLLSSVSIALIGIRQFFYPNITPLVFQHNLRAVTQLNPHPYSRFLTKSLSFWN